MRIVIELRRGEPGLVILNNLYKLTQMQTTFGVINLSIVNGQPKVLSLIELLRSFIEHRVDVVRRRTEYELRQAEARAHILEGLKKALDHIDEIIKLIRASKTTAEAREGLIAEEDAVITVTHSGYVKRTPLSVYRQQGRGGKGRIGMKTKEEDPVTNVFVANTHSYVLVFTDLGRLYWLKVYEIPDASSAGRGKAIVNLANLSSEEKERALLSVKDFDPNVSVLMATRAGQVKKTSLEAFSNPSARGIMAMGVPDDDELIAAEIVSANETVFIGTHDGMAIRFAHDEIREMGRQAYGVIGIRL